MRDTDQQCRDNITQEYHGTPRLGQRTYERHHRLVPLSSKALSVRSGSPRFGGSTCALCAQMSRQGRHSNNCGSGESKRPCK